jgi:hypothetical protein
MEKFSTRVFVSPVLLFRRSYLYIVSGFSGISFSAPRFDARRGIRNPVKKDAARAASARALDKPAGFRL